MLDNTQHRMKELVCLNFRPGITWKERKQVIGKYIPANIDPWQETKNNTNKNSYSRTPPINPLEPKPVSKSKYNVQYWQFNPLGMALQIF